MGAMRQLDAERANFGLSVIPPGREVVDSGRTLMDVGTDCECYGLIATVDFRFARDTSRTRSRGNLHSSAP